ncbi:MAG: hypothetical protein KC593_21315, partial [Myxococcales bacterium]|nr:hypothetical protein [Myxococcales bacterium]
MLSLSRQVLLAARDLPSRDDPTREAAAVAIDGLLRSASPRDIAELAAQARVSFAQIVFPQSVGSHRHMDPALLDAFPAPQRLAVAALLSTHRNGYVREVALHVLTDSGQPWVLPFMLLRCDDIVASLRASATAAVQRSLHPRYADALASSLGLLAQLAERQRGGGGSVVPSVRSFLAEPPQRPALLRASHDADPRVRRLAYALRLAQPVGESPLEVLSAALGDPAIGVHTWAARTAISGATSESDQRA